MEILLQIVNSTTIPPSDPNTANLVYGTWALVVVTLLGIIITAILTNKSLKETKQSNNLYRLELEHRLKTDIRYAPQNSVIDKEDSKLQLRGILNNEGQIEAHGFQIHVFTFKNEPTIAQILQNEKKMKKTSLPIEGSFPYQQRTYQFVYKVDWNFEGILFAVLWIRCKFFEDSEDEKIYVLRCSGEPCETWNIFTKFNIERSRKDLKTREEGAPI